MRFSEKTFPRPYGKGDRGKGPIFSRRLTVFRTRVSILRKNEIQRTAI